MNLVSTLIQLPSSAREAGMRANTCLRRVALHHFGVWSAAHALWLTAICRGRRVLLVMLGLPMLSGVSCTAVPAFQQQRLAKSNMVFDDTNAFAFSARLLPQSEPGTGSTGAAQGGGCTACK